MQFGIRTFALNTDSRQLGRDRDAIHVSPEAFKLPEPFGEKSLGLRPQRSA
jgi:hypothetical protein